MTHPPGSPDQPNPQSGRTVPVLSDEALMAGVRRGERLAFEALYSRYGSPVMRFLYRLCGDRILAEDLTQDTFLKVWRAAPRWRPIGRVSTWLFQIAKRHWWNEGAKRRRRAGITQPVEDDQAERMPGGETPPDMRLARTEIALLVRTAVDRLPRRLRLVFVLVRLEGASLAEAAQVASIPVGTVKSRLATAEKALRRRLDRYLG